MNWQCKAAAFKFFSVVPGGSRLHYWTQRNVTKSLPIGTEEFDREFAQAKDHVVALTSYGKKAICEAQFYEFGAGWDLSMALSFFALGVRRQILVDLFKLARVELVNETLKKLKRLGENGSIPNLPIRLLPEGRDEGWVQALEEWYGIKYLAPCDARNMGLDSQSVDYVTSTNTLEHIPQTDAGSILRECRRILRPDGIISSIIDYRDHYAYADSGISVYNFLKYRPSSWALFNSPFHFQNRLRHSDYVRMAEREGFEIIEERAEGALPDSLADVLRQGIAAEFRRYEVDDLGVCQGHIVLRPRMSSPGVAE
jgi:SAM-dependent methyltransferase